MASQRPRIAYERLLDAGHRVIGDRGFAAVGLNEILAAAGVAKGSFYHLFSSKQAFGEALLKRYFEGALSELDRALSDPTQNAADRLMVYWSQWSEAQGAAASDRCLVVKLAAEVADSSCLMRRALKNGTSVIVSRIAATLRAGVKDRSIFLQEEPEAVAEALYELWLGAALMAKISSSGRPLEGALVSTRRALGMSTNLGEPRASRFAAFSTMASVASSSESVRSRPPL